MCAGKGRDLAFHLSERKRENIYHKDASWLVDGFLHSCTLACTRMYCRVVGVVWNASSVASLGTFARLLPNTHLLVSAGMGRLTIMLRSRTLAALVLVCILALSQDGLVQPASAVVVGLSQDNKDGAIDVRINHEEGSGSPYQVTHVQADAEGTKREWVRAWSCRASSLWP